MQRLLPYLAFVVFIFSSAAQADSPLVQFGERFTLHSKILNEDRPYWIRLPPTYQDNADQKYPVLYLLDAEWNFYWVGPVMQFMEESRQIPEFIVVGVPNKDRDRDLTPTEYPNVPSSGGGPQFERFLNEELALEIDAKFRTVPCRILVGHSAGGALAADAFLRQTNGFQGYMAIDPALGWVNQDLIRRAEEFVPQENSHTAIFITTAGWRSSKQTNAMSDAQEQIVSILRTNSSRGIRIGYEVESEDHNSSRLLGLYDGLRFIFEGYKPVDPSVLNTSLLINEHFEQLSSRLGFKVLPPEGLVLGIGYGCLDAHETNDAIECLKLNVSNYPTSAYAHKHLADVYRVAGKRDLAIQNYEKALELGPNTDGVKEALEELRR